MLADHFHDAATAAPTTAATDELAHKLPRALRRFRTRPREKMFGMGRPRALDRNAKVRIIHLARAPSRKTEKGRAYGQITAKALAVLEALLWGFHNARSGLWFTYSRCNLQDLQEM